jgi:uncharacterized RDD family membrane protein YckC
LCARPETAITAIAISTFHASGRNVEAAVLHDQRRDIESDITLRLGEVTSNMPYAVNRVRALEAFAASDLYAWWCARLATHPLPVRATLGPADGPVDRREVATRLRRFLALSIDCIVLSVIFHISRATIGVDTSHHTHLTIATLSPERIRAALSDSSLLLYFPYAAGLVAIAGRTIGMMVLDLRVVDCDHGRVGIARSVWRYVLAAACTLTVVPAIYGWFRRVQLHERWSGTRLVGNRTGFA